MNERPKHWHPRHKESDPARLVAFDVIRAVNADDAYANLIMPREIRRAGLRRLDAAFATNLCYGTLRMRGRWDAVISRCVQDRDILSIDPPVLDLLRLGCHQLLDFHTPVHAAINETVTIARNELGQNTGGFVNAVLRRVSEKADDWEEILRSSSTSERAFISTWYSHPRWVVEALEESLVANGRSSDELTSLLEADNTPAKVALVPREITREQLEANLEQFHVSYQGGYLMPQAVLIDSGDPHRIRSVQNGAAGVQDEGSQLIAGILAEAPIEGSDELWLDMCAGPGGKTATLAAVASQRGARIHANEPFAHRLDLVADSVEPWADTVALRLGDGRELGVMESETYDRILVDAPCSGLGALRRRPEARWRKQGSDVTDLAVLQSELLAAAFAALRPGGALVYSTCSPVLAETHAIVTGFFANHPQAALVDCGPIASSIAVRDVPSHNGFIQLWPDRDQTDGMFIALITKNHK